MINNEVIISVIKSLLKGNIKCEDNNIYISNKFKYDVFNLLVEHDQEFKKELFKELEYCEND